MKGAQKPKKGAKKPAQKTLKERGYTGAYYQTHGVSNNDFLRGGGKEVDGTLLPSGPVLVAAQLPDGHPVRKSALEYVGKYADASASSPAAAAAGGASGASSGPSAPAK